MTLATPRNMRIHEGYGVVAYSPATGEEYSATPGDYWNMPDDECLTDSEGNEMILGVRYSGVEAI